MNLYIITHSWNTQGHEHGVRNIVYTTREEAEARLQAEREGFEEMVEDNEDAFNYWSTDTEIELCDADNESNFDHYELTEEWVDIRL